MIDTVGHDYASRPVLPSLRMGRIMGDLDAYGYSPEEIRDILDIIGKHLERGTQRVGSLCPAAACKRVLSINSNHRYVCEVHGPVSADGGLQLVIAYDPIPSSS